MCVAGIISNDVAWSPSNSSLVRNRLNMRALVLRRLEHQRTRRNSQISRPRELLSGHKPNNLSAAYPQKMLGYDGHGRRMILAPLAIDIVSKRGCYIRCSVFHVRELQCEIISLTSTLDSCADSGHLREGTIVWLTRA